MPYLSIVCVKPFDVGVLSFGVVPFEGYCRTNGQTTIYKTYKNWRCESDVDTDSDPTNLCSYSVSFIEEANNLCIVFDLDQ
jgi:hypothetical protein